MKTSELKLGNLVYWNIPEKTDVPHKVIGILQTRLHTIPISLGDSIADFLPIPITEEWLLNLGFVKEPKADNVYSRKRLRIWGHMVYLIEEDTLIGHYIPTEVRFVHQLQNLYFALTGTELTAIGS